MVCGKKVFCVVPCRAALTVDAVEQFVDQIYACVVIRELHGNTIIIL